MLGQLLKGAVMVAAVENARRAARRAMVLAIALVFFLIATGFLLAASWQALAAATSSLTATLIVGGANLAFALVLVVIANAGGRQSNIGKRLAETAERDLSAFHESLKGVSPLLPIVGAVAIGYLLTGKRR